MTLFELKIALKAHNLHVYTDTGGIYTFMGRYFIASVSGMDRSKPHPSVAVVRLNKNHINTHPDYYKAIQTVCVLNEIQVVGVD